MLVKTSILTRLRLHEYRPTVPTVGFTVETVTLERVHFTVLGCWWTSN